MKKHYLIGFAACTLVLASCSSKNKIDDLGGGKTDDAISFSTSIKDSRGTAILDNAGLQTAGNFGVTAFHSATDQPNPYMGGDKVGAKIIYKTDKWDYDNPADARYWPDAEASLTFYGYTPFDGTKRGAAPAFTKDGGMVFDNYVVPIAVADQEDFMWAYTSTNKTAIPSKGVVMNFNHALVRVNFQACVTTSTLKVDIAENGITICNIKKKGKVTVVPAGTFSWGDPTAADVQLLNNIIVPSNLAKIEYNATTPDQATAVSSNEVGKAVMLMPQTFAAWAPTPGGTAATASGLGYLKVMCKIYSATAPVTYYHGTATESTPNAKDDYKPIYIPLSSIKLPGTTQIWVANNNITYTLNFGGGYADDGTPILNPTLFTTTVKEWTKTDGGTLPM